MRRGIQLGLLALAMLMLLTACQRAHEEDRHLLERMTLQPGDLGRGWRTVKLRAPKRCMPSAIVCLDGILLRVGQPSGTAIALTSLFPTSEAAMAHHKRTLRLLSPVGGRQAPPAETAQLLRRRKEHYSARVTAREAFRDGRARALLVIERIAITGGSDATHYDAEFLYVVDGRVNMTVIVGPRRLSPPPRKLLARLVARIETARA